MRHSCCCWWKRSRWLSKMRYFYSRFQWMTIYLVASNRCVFPQQQNFAMGSLAQISSGAIRCSFYTRFRRSSGSFWCRYPVRFRKVPVQIPGDVPEGSGEDAWWGSGSFRCRYLVKIPGEVLEGSGADTWWDSGGFPCGEVPEGSAADTWWRSGGFRSRCLVRFRWVLMMMVGEVSEGSRTAAVWKRRWSFQAVGDSAGVYSCYWSSVFNSHDFGISVRRSLFPYEPPPVPLLAFRWLAQHLWPPRAQMVIIFENLWIYDKKGTVSSCQDVTSRTHRLASCLVSNSSKCEGSLWLILKAAIKNPGSRGSINVWTWADIWVPIMVGCSFLEGVHLWSKSTNIIFMSVSNTEYLRGFYAALPPISSQTYPKKIWDW